MSKRVLFAGIAHETHTFVRGLSRLSDFKVARGAEIWRAEGDTSTVAGGLAIAKACGWDVIPIIEIIGMAGALVHDEVVDEFWRTFEPAALREIKQGLDGIWLNLHGAGVSQSLLDIEGELLRRIRALPGFAEILICGVLDPHGNFTQQMADHSNALVAYRKNPHSDGKEAAMDSARILDRLMNSGEKCATVRERPLIVLPPTATGTADEPFVSIEAAAREIERTHPDILAVNVFLGFAYADMPDVGVSFSACTVGDPTVARTHLKKLSEMILANKRFALPAGLQADEAIARLNGKGLTVLIEQSDNIGGGAPGDLTQVLAALLRHNLQHAGVVIDDADAVQQLSALPIGTQTRMSIGGKSGGIGAQPIPLDLELISTSDGRFVIEDPHSHMAVNGRHVDMGPSAVVKSGGVTILITSHATPPMDLAQWRSQGIAPEQFSVIVVKAAVAHKQAYDPITTTSIVLNTPGPCTADLCTLPYQHAKKPLYPLSDQ